MGRRRFIEARRPPLKITVSPLFFFPLMADDNTPTDGDENNDPARPAFDNYHQEEADKARASTAGARSRPCWTHPKPTTSGRPTTPTATAGGGKRCP